MENQENRAKNQEIRKTEAWLRDHPHAEGQVRHDMMRKLAELKKQ